MAQMFPSSFPALAAQDPMRSAEQRMYRCLADSLDDRYEVYYSVAWVAKKRGQAARDGETDFVVGHPDRGLLLIEVKGGGVSYDPVAGAWQTVDRHGKANQLRRSPFVQVKDSKYSLDAKLKEHPRWKGPRVTMGHAVALVDCPRRKDPLGPDAPSEITLFQEDMKSLGKRVAALFDYWSDQTLGVPNASDRGQAGPQWLSVAREVLAPSFELRTPLGARVAEAEFNILRLDEQQFELLSNLSRARRVGVSGAAGTGKTILAFEKARRLANEGFQVLLTCRNRPLAEHLRTRANDLPGLRVMDFHQLCQWYAKQAGLVVHGKGSEVFKRLEESLIQALDRVSERFDALIVDEGQEFEESWFDDLEYCLRDSDGIFYVFFDDNQRFFKQPPPLVRKFHPFCLPKNYRNSRPIYERVRPYYSGDTLKSAGPQGQPVEFVSVRSRDAIRGETERVLNRLIINERVKPHDVAVLVGTAMEKSVFAGARQIGKFPVVPAEEADARDDVVLDTIHRFKGLERPVVVLSDIEALAGEAADRDRVLYVGLSRARAHLCIVATAELLARTGLRVPLGPDCVDDDVLF